MTDEVKALIREDIEIIREILADCEAYSFSKELCERMNALGLSSSALGERAGVSHTIIDKWRQGKARPNGKERMKELGMALGMDEAELNMFLYRNGYPRLHAKNPMDSAAKLLLINGAGRSDAVDMYRELIGRLGLANYIPQKDALSLKTSVLSADLMEAERQGQISGWFKAHDMKRALRRRMSRCLKSAIRRIPIGALWTMCETCFPCFARKGCSARTK